MRSRVLVQLIVALGLSFIRAGAADTVPSDAAKFFQAPEFLEPAVSPDGRSIAVIARHNGHACVFRFEPATGKMDGVFDPGGGEVERCWWLGNQRLLIAAVGEFGRSFFVQQMDGSKPRLLKPLDRVPLAWVHPIAGDPDHLAAVKNHDDRLPVLASITMTRAWENLYVARVDVARGSAQHVESLEPDEIDYGPLFTRDAADPLLETLSPEATRTAVFSASGELRAKTAIDGALWHVMWRASDKEPWHEIKGRESHPTFVPLAVARDSRHLVVVAHDQGDTTAVMLLDPATDHRELLAQRPDRDVEQLIWNPAHFYPVGATFFGFGPEDAEYFEPDARALRDALRRTLPATTNRVVSASDDGAILVIKTWSPSTPPRYFVLSQATGRMSLLGQELPGLESAALGQLEQFKFPTRDGLTEFGCVLWPPGADPSRRYPLLLLPLQFPSENLPATGRFNPAEQYFASRGIAVAHLGVRGGAGFGRKFQLAGNFELIGNIAHDVEDGVRYLERESRVAAGRVALMGIWADGKS